MRTWTTTLAAMALTALLAIFSSSPTSAERWVVPIAVPALQSLKARDRTAFAHAGIIVTDFAKPQHNWLPGHRGIDLAPPLDANVHAPAPGTIGFVGQVAGKPVVTILHAGGLRSTFEPVFTDLPKGAEVQAGQVIGTLSIDGPWHCPTSCLHWGVKNGDEYLDPWKYIRPHVRIILLQ